MGSEHSTTPPNGAALVPPGFPRRGLCLLLLLTLALRLGTNATRVDEYPLEGLYRGVISAALLEGAPLWPSQMLQIAHIRGSLAISVLALPAFELFGPTTFALRLTGILFHMAGLVALMLLVHRQLGRHAALFMGALFVLAAPGPAKGAVLSYGDHIESIPFVCTAAWLTLGWLDAGRPRPGLALAAGAAIGLAVSWHAQARLAMLPLALLCLLLAPRRLLSRECLFALLPGLVLGLIPLLLGDWLTATDGLAVFSHDPADMLLSSAGSSSVGDWWRFWITDVPRALQYENRAWSRGLWALSAACAAGLLLAAVSSLRAGRTRPRELLARGGFFAAYVLAFSVLYAASRFRVKPETDNAIQARFLLPVLPFLLLPIAVAAARLSDAGRRAGAALILVPALAVGGWGSLSTIDMDSVLHEPARRVDLWQLHDLHFAWGSLAEDERAELRRLELALRGDPGQQAVLLEYLDAHADAGATLELVRRFDRQPEWLLPLRHRLPGLLPSPPRGGAARAAARLASSYAAVAPELRPFAAVAWASELMQARVLDPLAVQALLEAGKTPFERACAARGLGMALLHLPGAVPKRFRGEHCATLLACLGSEAARTQAAFGLGFETGTLLGPFYPPGAHVVREVLEHAPRALHVAFATGAGAGYRQRLLVPPTRALDSPALRRLLALFPQELHAAFREGLAGAGGEGHWISADPSAGSTAATAPDGR